MVNRRLSPGNKGPAKMADKLATFLEPVFTAFGETKQMDRPYEDARVVQAVYQAHGMIIHHCNRSFFHQDYLKQKYFNVGRILHLRDTPISKLAKVVVYLDIAFEGDELTLDEDVTLVGDMLVFGGLGEYDCYEMVEVDLEGGYGLVDEDYKLLTAYTLQSVSNYHTRDYIGLDSIAASSHGLVQTPTDKGISLLTEVKNLLSKFQYIGNAE